MTILNYLFYIQLTPLSADITDQECFPGLIVFILISTDGDSDGLLLLYSVHSVVFLIGDCSKMCHPPSSKLSIYFVT